MKLLIITGNKYLGSVQDITCDACKKVINLLGFRDWLPQRQEFIVGSLMLNHILIQGPALCEDSAIAPYPGFVYRDSRNRETNRIPGLDSGIDTIRERSHMDSDVV